MDIVIASNNKNKLKEIREILGEKFDNIFSLQDLSLDVDAEETEETFEGNALIKARAVCLASKMPSLSDDSGLEVDYLGGAPGVHSARYSGVHGDNDANNQKLLNVMKGAKNRACRFVSAVALVYPNGVEITARGSVEGVLLDELVGKGGFGYDPMFFSTELNKSFGEATEEEKNSVSHRARALENLLEKMQ